MKIFVFIPDTLEMDQVGFLEGFSKTHETSLAFYITNNKVCDRPPTNFIGLCGMNSPKLHYNEGNLEQVQWLHFNCNTKEISVQNLNFNVEVELKRISYDFNAFSHSQLDLETTGEYGAYFQTLFEALHSKILQEKKNVFRKLHFFSVSLFILLINGVLWGTSKVISARKCLSVLGHFQNRMMLLKWVFLDLIKERKFTSKSRNIIISCVFDVVLGVFCSYFVVNSFESILQLIRMSEEGVIQGLENLLRVLMGSPAGLKLNFGFNNALGKFFFYHISLWRAFLHAFEPFVPRVINLFVIFGGFGFSFQVSFMSDFIGFITFHVYCIYVYAARLYWLQAKALISLWRLFIGRKYNPLRNRVDSCRYTHHQLFVGTLGFTILLFLLPTTLLYYGVLTFFRIGLVLTDYSLKKTKDIFQNLPLYIIFLWIFNSPSVAGTIFLRLKKNEIFVTLKKLPFFKCIRVCTLKEFVVEPPLGFGALLHNAFTGVLI